MLLSCIKCSQLFHLENFTLGKPQVTCPNSLCGYVETLDVLIERKYGLELGIRCRTMMEQLSKPFNQKDWAWRLTIRLVEACRKIDLERNPPKSLAVAKSTLPQKVDWWKLPPKVRQVNTHSNTRFTNSDQW